MFDGLDRGAQALFVAPGDLLIWADRVRPHIAKMADGSGGRYEASDIFSALASGRMLMWVALDGVTLLCVMLGEIVDYPRVRVLRLTGLVGNQPLKWRGMLPAIEDQARRQFGCGMVESIHQSCHKVLLRGYETTHWRSEKIL